jgi:uncharacterized membrane protein
MSLDLITLAACYCINPFFRKSAITGLNHTTGHALLLFTNNIIFLIYFYVEKDNIVIQHITKKNIRNSILSSIITVTGTCQLNKLLKKNKVSFLTSKIQILMVIFTYVIDYFANRYF